MKILTLNDYEEQFLDLCLEFYKSNDRNKDWFNPDIKWSVYNTYKQFPLWTFLLDDNDKFIAMSAVQTHKFPQGCARVLTRTYYGPEARRHHMSYEKSGKSSDMTPAMYMLKAQLDWADTQNLPHLFFSVEYLRRKATITKLAEKIQDKYQQRWYVQNNLFQTYPQDSDPASWQVICTNTPTIPMKNISIDEWKQRYDR